MNIYKIHTSDTIYKIPGDKMYLTESHVIIEQNGLAVCIIQDFQIVFLDGVHNEEQG